MASTTIVSTESFSMGQMIQWLIGIPKRDGLRSLQFFSSWKRGLPSSIIHIINLHQMTWKIIPGRPGPKISDGLEVSFTEITWRWSHEAMKPWRLELSDRAQKAMSTGGDSDKQVLIHFKLKSKLKWIVHGNVNLTSIFNRGFWGTLKTPINRVNIPSHRCLAGLYTP